MSDSEISKSSLSENSDNKSFFISDILGICPGRLKDLRNTDMSPLTCFLRNVKNYKSLSGVELRKECINISKNFFI